MQRIIRVYVVSRDSPPIVNAYGTIGGTARSLVAAGACAGSIESRKLSVGTPQEAVIHTVHVTVDPRDCPQLIEAYVTTGTTCALVAACARAGNVKRFQFALGIAHQAVVNKVTAVVLEASRNCSKCIYVGSSRSKTPFRTVACARVWTNPRRKLPVGTAQESVERIVRVGVDTYDGSLKIKRLWSGAVAAHAWNVEGRKISIGTPQKPVAKAVRVPVVSRDRPQVVDATRIGSIVGTRGRIRAGSLERDELALRAS